MKILFAVIMMLITVPELFAREYCPAIQPTISPTLKSMGLSADSMNCVATKNQYNCQKVEDELEQDQKYKVIQCDAKSLEANRLGNVSLVDCIWNGFKISGELLVNLAEIPGAIAGQIAKGFQETQICNASVDKKREILKAFNLTIEDPRYKLEEHRLGRWLNDASCSEIEKLLSARYQSYQANIYKERVWAINAGKKPAPLIRTEDKSSGPGLAEMLNSAMTDLRSTYECYTPKVKAEMICAGVTTLLADVALGGGVAIAAKRMAAVVKSAKALSRVRTAASSGEAVDLADAALLLNRDRVKAAAAVLNRTRPMSEVERKAIIAAHEVGKKEKRGFYTYTKEDIAKKARILREAGFDPKDTRALMEAGITGNFRNDSWAKSALMNYMDKLLKVSTTALQQESLLAIHDLGLSTGKGFVEKAKEILKKANFNDSQINAILKAKADNESGLLSAANAATVEKKAAEVVTKAEDVKKATEAIRQPAAPTVAKIEDSAGRKAVLNNFKDDELLKIQHTEIPDNLTGEALEAKKRARRTNAQEIIKKIEKKERREFDAQAIIIESGSSVSKSKKALVEAEEQMAKLPKVGAEMRRKELQDKIDRSSTSLEMYQKRCKAALELYREAHGYAQYMRQYERDFDAYCK